MCGIVGYVGERKVVNVLLNGLEKLEYRGYDSAGIALLDHKTLQVIKTKGRLENLKQAMEQENVIQGSCGIGHTRWATHGEPNQINAHPHGNDRLAIVHNGIIENYAILKDKLYAKGYRFVSETDTEVMLNLLDDYYDGDPFQAIRSAMLAIDGAYALAIVFKDFPNTIFAVRQNSPLIIGVGKHSNEFFIASDIPAILEYTRDYYLIDEHEIVILTKEKAKIFNLNQQLVEKKLYTATWDLEEAEKGGYPHFMLKEIYEQPEVLEKTINPRISNHMPDLSQDGIKDEWLEQIHSIHIVGCGTASYAGMVGQTMIKTLANLPTQVWIASEFRYCHPILHKQDLVIVVSQSGETADTFAALRLAKSKGIATLAIVNVVGSSIAREADAVFYTWAGLEVSVASTKAYTVQLAAFFLIGLRLSWVRGILDEEDIKGYVHQLEIIPKKLKKTLEQSDLLKQTASQFHNTEHMFFMGRGIDYTLSLEGALKLKEISYIHAEACAAGELKHGTIALIRDDIPVVAVATQCRIYEKMINNIKEVVTRGAKVLLIVPESFIVPDHLVKFILTLPITDELLMPFIATIPLQLFAYYTAVLRGCDVDRPRNLAKSVTVE